MIVPSTSASIGLREVSSHMLFRFVCLGIDFIGNAVMSFYSKVFVTKGFCLEGISWQNSVML